MFAPLNLPPCTVQVKQDGAGTALIFDPLRGRWLVATPEEWVRQNFTGYLMQHRAYPASLMANEVSLSLNGTRRRCDTLIYTHTLRPLCIVEYKRPTVAVTRRVFDQIARYNSVLGARYLIVSNGLHHYCCRFEGEGYAFLDNIPDYTLMENNIS